MNRFWRPGLHSSTNIEQTKCPTLNSRVHSLGGLNLICAAVGSEGQKGQFFEVPHIIMRDMDDHQKDEYDLMPGGRD